MISAAHAVFADPILPILVSDQRFIVASAGVGGQQTHPTVVKTPSAPFSLFVEEATTTAADASVTASATATQRSSVDGMSFSVFGSSESSAASTSSSENSGFGTGRSTFEIEFDLAAPLRYALTGELAFPHSEIEGEDAIALGEAAVFLENEPLSGGLRVINGIDTGSESQFAFAGLLPAGRYRFFAEASTESLALRGGRSHLGSTFDFDFTLTPTPELGSLLLFASGAVALVASTCWPGFISAMKVRHECRIR
jgi:hypothetical protein